ncbi:pentapeptide repeat-containing protein [Candidatus Dependentiae bacterium]|nr:pentapeptide repeat-containing protein [Candidatus Dependentiae bacterium]MBU4387755.1 pentapeptide repeat-containing protein [Candidatus Dependentiae bacterium]MCG2755884.1 pentapeptide repeat-containing protein [Candidatus Dependentiae bacterium]
MNFKLVKKFLSFTLLISFGQFCFALEKDVKTDMDANIDQSKLIEDLKKIDRNGMTDYYSLAISTGLRLFSQIEKAEGLETFYYKGTEPHEIVDFISETGEINYITPIISDDIDIKFIDFSGAQLKDELIFRSHDQARNVFGNKIAGDLFEKDVRFKKITTTNNILFDGVRFTKPVSFAGSIFKSGTFRKKTITFENVEFESDLDFSNVNIYSGVTLILKNVYIKGKLKFDGMIVENGGRIILDSVNSKQRQTAVELSPIGIDHEKYIEIKNSNVIFTSGAVSFQAFVDGFEDYKKAKTKENIKKFLLSYLKINKEKNKKGVWFLKDSKYELSKEKRTIPFKGVLTPQDFADTAVYYFDGAIINNTISFEPNGKNKIFNWPMYFRDITLTTNMIFENIIFKSTVNFSGCEFKKGAFFEKKIIFRNVIFEGNLDLSNIKLEDGTSVVLDNVVFKGNLITNNMKTSSKIFKI